MLVEMDAIEGNGTCLLSDLPPGRRAIGLNWFFKVKGGANGNIVKLKARPIIKGYAQGRGINYN
jgi:hypothetical protein